MFDHPTRFVATFTDKLDPECFCRFVVMPGSPELAIVKELMRPDARLPFTISSLLEMSKEEAGKIMHSRSEAEWIMVEAVSTAMMVAAAVGLVPPFADEKPVGAMLH